MTDRGRQALVLVVAVLLVSVCAMVAGLADEESVVITRPGVVFHKVGSSDLRGRGLERSLSQAESAGYIPCPVCYAKTTSASSAGHVGSFNLLSGPSLKSAAAPPGLGRMTAPVVQPNGTKSGAVAAGGSARGAIKDPYMQPKTVQQPGRDQGAYGPSTR